MKKFLFVLVFFSIIGLTSCNKDPEITNEEELITTLVYNFDAPGSGTDVVFTFKDIDGDGGTAPVVTVSGHIKLGEVYTGSLTLLNESVKPVDDITPEILAEALVHQFFFDVSGTGKLTITYDDKDSQNNPLGLKTKITATGAGIAKLKVTLRHEPNKKGSGVSAGNIANAGGETDLEVTFNVEVK